MKVLFILAFILGGCMTNKTVWEKPGGTQVGFDMDKQQCIYEARMATPATPMTGYGSGFADLFAEQLRKNELETLCMKARGYTPRIVAAG